MSLRLGPIHNWLYNQIKVIEGREEKIVREFTDKYGGGEEIVKPLREKYGQLKGDTPLEELIGDTHIHPWLEGAITTVQSRESALVKELVEEYEDKDLLHKVYFEDGQSLAQSLNKERALQLEEVFKFLKDTLVERMPCDRLSVVEKEDNKIIWRHNNKLHQEFWEEVGVEIDLMHHLYTIWIEGFIKELNPNITYERVFEEEYYIDIFEE
ncbi:hypothetical protein [Halonatronum saccharophilum]|uniref:hypothetical protein n=1 Tax=Halonatronum saccharophilum TaxID=150060 RepID=UPI0004875953|nr:hypothetical protein [Halonatronum saccharophilum]